jgi:hypothetical protein
MKFPIGVRVEAAAVFGQVLRIAGTDHAALEQSTRSAEASPLVWHEVAAKLEDVFIHLLSQKPGGGS